MSILLGLLLLVGGVVGGVYASAPALINKLSLTEAEAISYRWLDHLALEFDLPGEPPQDISSRHSLVYSIFPKMDIAPEQQPDLLNPQGYFKVNNLTVLEAYSVYTSAGDTIVAGGNISAVAISPEQHKRILRRVIDDGRIISVSRPLNAESPARSFAIYFPLRKSGKVTGVGRMTLESSPFQAVVLGAFQRGATVMAFLVVMIVSIVLLVLYFSLKTQAGAEFEAAYLAYRDPLTDLANRRTLSEDLPEWCDRVSKAYGGSMVVLDIDHFKEVNDTYGHGIADNLLAVIGDRLALLPDDCTAYRLSGDEFVILMQSPFGVADLERSLLELIEELQAPVVLDEVTLHPRLSVGVAHAPIHARNADDLARYADMALNEAKRLGRNQVQFFSPDMAESRMRESYLRQRLELAIADNAIDVHYQPQIDVAAGKIIGFEALARWTDPIEGPISPAEFIPLAEKYCLINDIGTIVLEEACRSASGWPGGETVAVNISPLQIAETDILETVTRVLAQTRLAPERLELEITESVFFGDDPCVVERLKDLRSMGIGLALDDFGTGYSSLSSISLVPLNKIKIDRSFISKFATDETAEAIIKSVLQIAGSLEAKVIAEGVETHAQVRGLTDLGCTLAQGYLYGKPTPTPFGEQQSHVDATVQLIETGLTKARLDPATLIAAG